MFRFQGFLGTCVLRASAFAALSVAALGSTIGGTASWDGGSASWQARRNLVTTIAPSDPNYVPVHGTPIAGYSGVAGLLINGPQGASICTGSLVNGFQLLTAAHCLADGTGSLTATSAQAVFFTDTGTYVGASTSFEIHPDYTGSVFDDHDIAIVNLSAEAPGNIERYGLYYDDAVGDVFEVVGFGARGQGDTGITIPAQTRIRGYNEFDAIGAALLPFLGILTADNVYMFDFDNGNPANDAFGYWLGPTFFGLGLGMFETNTAPGDSGGPSFVEGRIAAVTSFGLTFTVTLTDGTVFNSDVLEGLNSSFGEFSGNTSVRANQDWLASVLVPEPSTYLLMGVGLLGLAWMRRRQAK
jgi:hypothetical protein